MFQVGGRHKYSIPESLHRRQLLAAFVTDFALSASQARLLRPFLWGRIRKALRGRTVSDALAKKTHQSLRLLRAARRFREQDLSQANEASWDEMLATLVEKQRTPATRVVVGLYLESLTAFERMREQGIQTLMEVYIAPQSAYLVRDENLRFPEFSDSRYDEMSRYGDAVWERAVAVTNHYIVPSDFVGQGLRERGVPDSAIRRVPYGVPSDFFEVVNRPIAKRVLFVGTADIRKGIHHFAAAAQELRGRGYEFRVVGGASPKIEALLAASGVVHLGRIPREDTLREYASADVLVLPTIAEGSATVAYEAMAAGVPVITTPNAGSIITHERDGLIVPTGDHQSVVEQIDRLANDQPLRDRLADQARATAQRYRLDDYGERFVDATLDLTSPHSPGPDPMPTPHRTCTL